MTDRGPDPVVEARDLRVYFATRTGETVKAVDRVDLAVVPRETFGVIGESGSGKSTLGRALVGLIKPEGGTVLQGGTDPQSLSPRERRRIGRDYQIIFQDPHSALNPRMTILSSVSEPLDVLGVRRNEARDRGLAALERVGLGPAFANRYPHELSGGQKQRVNIARALTLEPRLLVCDEIVAALDVSIQAEILNLLADLQRELGLTYVFITHDLGVVSHISDRIAVMYLGIFVELGPAEKIAKHPRHPYTEALLSAEPMPVPSYMRRSDRIILEGEIPSPVSPPSGCRFRTRCRFAQAVCAAERPEFRPIGPGHYTACHFAEEIRLKSRHDLARSEPA